jgi:hypothetical protein
MAEILASDLSKCGDEIPLLGVSREFDFGQFIELFDSTEDLEDPTRPTLARIVIQPSSTLASDRNAATGAPTASTVSMLTAGSASRSLEVKRLRNNSAILAPAVSIFQPGALEPEVHLFDLLENGPGAKLAPIEVEIKDQKTFFAEGTLEVAKKKYKVQLDKATRDWMSMGLPFNTFAEPSDGIGKIPLRISLPFLQMNLTQDDLVQILAGGDLQSAGLPHAMPVLTPMAIRTLLSGVAVLTHAIGPEERKTPVKLVPPSLDHEPIAKRFEIFDLPTFLAAPFVLSKDGAPVAVELTPVNVNQLISSGRTQVDVGDPIELTVINDIKSAEFGSYIDAANQLQNIYEGLISLKPYGVTWDEVVRLGTALEKDPHFVNPLVPDAVGGRGQYTEGSAGQVGRGLKTMTDNIQPRLPTGTGLPVAVFVPWKQTWTLKGFSRGNLLNTIALAPQEEITMQVFNWERRSRTLEQSAETDISQQTDITQTTRDTEDVFREMLAKRDFAWQLNGSLDASYSPGVASIKVHADGGVSETNSIQQTARNSKQSIRESTIKASSRVNSRRVTRVTQSVESGREERVTRVIRNPNQCHTLTLDFFETLAHYEIKLEFIKDRLRLVVLVPNPINCPDFQSAIIRRNETALNNSLIEPALRDGFDACRLVAAYDEAKKIVEKQKLDAEKVDDIGAQRDTPPPSTVTDPAAPQQAEVERIVTEMLSALKRIRENAQIDTAMVAIAFHLPVSEADRRSGQQWLFINFVAVKFPALLAALDDLSSSGAVAPLSAAQKILAVLPRPDGPTNLGNLNQMSNSDKEAACIASKLKQTNSSGARIYMRFDADWAWWTGRLQEEGLYTSNDGGLGGLADQLQKAYTAWEAKKAQGEAMKDQNVAKTEAEGKQEKTTTDDKLSMAFPLEELARAYERMKCLQDHLNEHREFYNYTLFQALPPSEQSLRIVQASNGKLQVGLFEPRVVAMSGSRLVVPLTPLASSKTLQDFVANLGNDLSDAFAAADSEPDTSILPTPGVSINSRLGKCTACEDYIETARSYELRRLEAVADQEKRETDRRQARLEAENYDDFRQPSTAVKLEIENKHSADT